MCSDSVASAAEIAFPSQKRFNQTARQALAVPALPKVFL